MTDNLLSDRASAAPRAWTEAAAGAGNHLPGPDAQETMPSTTMKYRLEDDLFYLDLPLLESPRVATGRVGAMVRAFAAPGALEEAAVVAGDRFSGPDA